MEYFLASTGLPVEGKVALGLWPNGLQVTMKSIVRQIWGRKNCTTVTVPFAVLLVALTQCFVPAVLLGEADDEDSLLLPGLEFSTLPLASIQLSSVDRAASGRAILHPSTSLRPLATPGPFAARAPPLV